MVTIKRIEHYTTQDIFESFEKLHKYAMCCLKEVQENGEQLKQSDSQQEGAWTSVMELLGKDIWKVYNDYIE